MMTGWRDVGKQFVEAGAVIVPAPDPGRRASLRWDGSFA